MWVRVLYLLFLKVYVIKELNQESLGFWKINLNL